MTMRYSEDATKAANYLREAIPMMVKHNVHPNPRNLALWYAYVSDQNDALKQEMDAIIAEHNTCPDEQAMDLFRRYIINEEADFADGVQNQLSQLINKLFQNSTSASSSNADYQRHLQQALSDVKTGDNLDSVVNVLVEQTQKAAQASEDFQKDITQAQSEIEFLKEQIKEIQQEASLDQLTQLNNRRAFDKESQNLAIAHAGNGQPLSLIVSDIDHFKKFNDTYGHLVGDKVLQSFAKLLDHVCQGTEFPARYGGEEFVVLLPGQDLSQAAAFAEKIRGATEKLKIKQRNSDELVSQITVSLGVAQYTPGESISELVERADKCLYVAKDNGRNQVVTADS